LAELLCRVDVGCELDTAESLRFACAQNLTDFESGQPKEEVIKPSLIGQLVGVCELRNRSDLNGRVGRVIAWHKDRERWEVQLEQYVPTERRERIAVRPLNITQAPKHFRTVNEYLKYRTAIQLEEGPQTPPGHVSGPALEKLRAAAPVGEEEPSICAICQLGTDEAVGSTEPNSAIVRLPCGHSYHMTCIIPWLKSAKTECPCCRHAF